MSAKRGEGDDRLDWLEALEERVREATGRLRELDEENTRLGERVEELEASLAAAGEAGESGGDGDASAADAEAWQREREEIRGRVEQLTDTLEGLLEGAAGDDD